MNGQEYANRYAYSHDRLVQVKHNTGVDNVGDVTYNFNYDSLSRPTTVTVGTQTLSTTTYNTDGSVANVVYGNHGCIANTYAPFKRLTAVRFDNEYTLLLMIGIKEEHTRVTDIIPTEGNFFQKGIDFLYRIGVK